MSKRTKKDGNSLEGRKSSAPCAIMLASQAPESVGGSRRIVLTYDFRNPLSGFKESFHDGICGSEPRFHLLNLSVSVRKCTIPISMFKHT